MVSVLQSSGPVHYPLSVEKAVVSGTPAIGIIHPLPIVRDGLARTVGGLVPGARLSLCGAPGEVAGELFALVVCELNLRLPECGLSALEELRKSLPQGGILVVSPLSEQQFGLPALRSGADAFLPQSASLEELGKALRSTLAGEGYISTEMAAVIADEAQGRGPGNGFARLSPRELDVIRHLIWGMRLKTVAATMGLNIRTASCYKKNALSKLGMSSLAEVVRYSSEQGLTV